MYEKLVWRLRHCSTSETPCKTCDWAGCVGCLDRIMLEAADAIESFLAAGDEEQIEVKHADGC